MAKLQILDNTDDFFALLKKALLGSKHLLDLGNCALNALHAQEFAPFAQFCSDKGYYIHMCIYRNVEQDQTLLRMADSEVTTHTHTTIVVPLQFTVVQQRTRKVQLACICIVHTVIDH